MKKLLVLLLLLSTSAFAQYPHHNHRHGGWGWVGPTIIGGVVGYEIARSQQPVIVQQQPIIVQQPTDIVYVNGIPYRRQYMIINGVQQEVLVR